MRWNSEPEITQFLFVTDEACEACKRILHDSSLFRLSFLKLTKSRGVSLGCGSVLLSLGDKRLDIRFLHLFCSYLLLSMWPFFCVDSYCKLKKSGGQKEGSTMPCNLSLKNLSAMVKLTFLQSRHTRNAAN